MTIRPGDKVRLNGDKDLKVESVENGLALFSWSGNGRRTEFMVPTDLLLNLSYDQEPEDAVDDQ